MGISDLRLRPEQSAYQQYDATGVAPHATTERIAYTVPSDWFLRLEHLSLAVIRATAPTTAGLAIILVRITPSGGTITEVARLCHLDATSGSSAVLSVPLDIILYPGDQVRVHTADASSGGTLDYHVGICARLYG